MHQPCNELVPEERTTVRRVRPQGVLCIRRDEGHAFMDDSVATFDFWGKIQKSGVRNSMTYRPQNSRKSHVATELTCPRKDTTTHENGDRVAEIGVPGVMAVMPSLA